MTCFLIVVFCGEAHGDVGVPGVRGLEYVLPPSRVEVPLFLTGSSNLTGSLAVMAGQLNHLIWDRCSQDIQPVCRYSEKRYSASPCPRTLVIERGDITKTMLTLYEHGLVADVSELNRLLSRIGGESSSAGDWIASWIDTLLLVQSQFLDERELRKRDPSRPWKQLLSRRRSRDRSDSHRAELGFSRVEALYGILVSGLEAGRGRIRSLIGGQGILDAPRYQSMLGHLERYRSLAQNPPPDLPRRFPVARRSHRRGKGARKRFWKKMEPSHYQALDSRLCSLGFCPSEDGSIENALKRYQITHHLKVTGMPDRSTVKSLSVPISHRVIQLRLSLHRMRRGQVYSRETELIVNIPSFQLEHRVKGEVSGIYRTQVGKSRHEPDGDSDDKFSWRTPIFSTLMRSVVVWPEWIVPAGLQRTMRRRMSADPDYARREGIEERMVRGRVQLVQKCGRRNPLAKVTFNMPNTNMVIIHDTRAKWAFDIRVRSMSHGCVRVDRAEDLARKVIGNDRGKQTLSRSEWRTIVRRIRTGRFRLRTPVPVHFVYWTADVDTNGDLAFYPDIYDIDDIEWSSFEQTHARLRDAYD